MHKIHTIFANKQKLPSGEKVYPCKQCGKLPVWGAFYLVCLGCGQESEYNEPNGNAVRTWNKANFVKES